MTISVILSGLTTTIYADDGMDEVLVQERAVSVDCWLDVGRVVKVVAPDGITFSGATGSLRRPSGFNLTELCDLAKLARDISGEREERAEMRREALAS